MILPCPFCGIDPVWVKDRYGGQLECHNVECYAQPSIRADDEDDAIAVWNRRPSPPVVDGELWREALDTLLFEAQEIADFGVDGTLFHGVDLVPLNHAIVGVKRALPKSPRSDK